MTLHPHPVPPVPDATAAATEAAFPKGNPYIDLRAELGTLYSDALFLPLFQPKGRLVEVAPWRLALILVLQHLEGLTDRQAADAVRRCIDWKYLLGLELTDPGFDFSLLSDFRERVLTGGLEQQFLDTLLILFKQRGLLKARGRQRTDSTHVLANVRTLNRLECVGETLRAALNQLAVMVPAWLRAQVTPDWFDRYGARIENYRLPTAESDRLTLAAQIGSDGFHLLEVIYDPTAPEWLQHVPAVAVLRHVWIQQYYGPPQGDTPVRWRTIEDLPPGAQLIHSPYDVEARWCQKRQTIWVGYKVHITETCDDSDLNLITHVTTTPATTSDNVMVEPIHQALANKDLLPKEHLLDGGYVDADQLVVSAQQHGVDVVGPVRPDQSWQARAKQGFDTACFMIDWDAQTVTCPRGQRSVQWKAGVDITGQDAIRVRFKKSDCLGCADRSSCTQAQSEPRELTFRPKAQWVALQAARQRQQTNDFRAQYGLRSGSESTISQATRGFDLRRTSYVGLAKTSLQHILIAVAINLSRFLVWLRGKPMGRLRMTPFGALAPNGGSP